MEPREGAAVGDNLRLLRPLASGGMGSVWVAEHRTLECEVAVKFIKRDALGDEQMLARFRREAKAAAQIKSPHVVQIFDQGVLDGGAPYIAMELLEGETLGERIERQGSLSLDVLSRVVSHAARALGAAHAHGVVHRDVKPENLFIMSVDGLPFVKLLDFGIAKRTQLPDDAATQSGVLVGTPRYMSPERLTRAKAATTQDDLWSLAAVAYHAAAGKPPFEGETLGALIIAITQGKFTRPSRLRTELGSEVDAWFERALCLEAKARFTDARELASTFAGVIASCDTDGTEANGGEADALGASGAAADTAEFVAAQQLALSHAPLSTSSAGEALTPEPETRTLDVPTSSPTDLVPAPPARRWLWPAAALGIVVLALGYVARGSLTEASPKDAPAPTTSERPSAIPTAVPNTSAETATPTSFGIEPTHIEVIDGAMPWIDGFRVALSPGETGKTYLEAHTTCHGRAMSLCSEMQYERACAQVERLGSVEVWTNSGTAEGFVLRGGERGCASRRVVEGGDRSSQRETLCCEHAIAITSDNKTPSFLQASERRVRVYEKALNGIDMNMLASVVADEISFNDTRYPREAYVAQARKYLRAAREHWELHDHCDVSVRDGKRGAVWVGDCSVVVHRDGEVAILRRRYLYGGEQAQLQSVDETRVVRPFKPLASPRR